MWNMSSFARHDSMPEQLTSHCLYLGLPPLMLCEMDVVFHVERPLAVEMGSEMLAN